MNRVYGAVVALAALVLVFGLGVAAQEPKQPPEPAQQAAPAPAPRAMMPGMVRMEIQRRHAALASQWKVTDYGIFVLRPGQLLKYDDDLRLVKAVDLPAIPQPPPGRRPEGKLDSAQKEAVRAQVARWMARAHSQLPARVEVTASSVFVSRGKHILKFSHNLELQKNITLPDAKADACPLCRQLMKSSMPGGHDVH